MRAIDADNLMDFYLMRPTEEFLYERQYTAEDVALKIENTPTIDTVKHGHWITKIRYSEFYDMILEESVCSCCGYNTGSALAKSLYDYCYKCGACMDEEVEE